MELAALPWFVAAVFAVMATAGIVAAVMRRTPAGQLPDVPGIPDEKLARPLRMGVMLALTIAFAAAVYWLARHQVGLLIFKANCITLGIVLGYWGDRFLCPDTRPHTFTDPTLRRSAEMRRTWLVIACVIATALGA